MRTRLIRDKDNQIVKVTATRTGWLIRRADGSVTEVRREESRTPQSPVVVVR